MCDCGDGSVDGVDGLLRLSQGRLNLGEASFQQGIFTRKISGIHGRE